MGLRVRSKYEDVVAWIRSGGGPPVPYPKRTELQLMDSHVYSQLNALMSAQETQHIVDEYRRDGFGRPPARRARQPTRPSAATWCAATRPPAAIRQPARRVVRPVATRQPARPATRQTPAQGPGER